MAKDFFQDITPPESNLPRKGQGFNPPVPEASQPSAPAPHASLGSHEPNTPEKTIRNIQVPLRSRPRFGSGDIREPEGSIPLKFRVKSYALWGAVSLALLALGAIAVISFRPTRVTVIPRTHAVLFDETARFTAYPASSAATGTLAFTIETKTFEDSAVVPGKGVEHVAERASGNITIFNEYSSQPVKLIKNTRFETPDRLVFRAPSEILVPGKRSSKPGEITVTIIADAPGEKYNVGPVSWFVVPGLKSTPDMYRNVYAKSNAAMTGGFSGERPAAEAGALEAARSEIRSRLQEKVRAVVKEYGESEFAFLELARITFESLPTATDGEKNVRVSERVRLDLPVFPSYLFADVVAESVSAEAEAGSVALKSGPAFSAHPTRGGSAGFGKEPLEFTLQGRAQLIWRVHAEELAKALAGRDKSAFQAIVEAFPEVEEAHARIEPFWKNIFPSDPAAIKIKVEEPKS